MGDTSRGGTGGGGGFEPLPLELSTGQYTPGGILACAGRSGGASSTLFGALFGALEAAASALFFWRTTLSQSFALGDGSGTTVTGKLALGGVGTAVAAAAAALAARFALRSCSSHSLALAMRKMIFYVSF